jgi:hypothetical protein
MMRPSSYRGHASMNDGEDAPYRVRDFGLRGDGGGGGIIVAIVRRCQEFRLVPFHGPVIENDGIVAIWTSPNGILAVMQIELQLLVLRPQPPTIVGVAFVVAVRRFAMMCVVCATAIVPLSSVPLVEGFLAMIRHRRRGWRDDDIARVQQLAYIGFDHQHVASAEIVLLLREREFEMTARHVDVAVHQPRSDVGAEARRAEAMPARR